ncbi:MAG: Omp28-related outer membrane protein [Paludibacteraceae bacterium]|nr:Omp28-related outer membrane protein [Paludibacteraceae bacterium]
MKQVMTILAVLLLSWQPASALIVNVNGHGEVPESGLEIQCTEATVDPLTEENVMELKGDLLCEGELKVTISRSSTGLTDEFCCATQCTPGNGQTSEELTFTPSGVTNWYAHYTPAEKSNETVTYTFAAGGESRVVKVNYVYGAEEPTSFPRKHLIEEFTGQDCGYCPYGMDAISEFMKDDDRWVLILHHYGYTQDHFSVSGSQTITNKLGVSGAPSSCIDRAKTKSQDGNKIVFHPGYLPTVDKNQFENTTYASIELSNTYDESSRKLDVHVSGVIAKADAPALKLTVLVKESGMIDYQQDYYGSYEGWEEFRHANAVRAYLTNALGNAVTVDEKQHYEADLSVTLNAKWVPENCMVVAFLGEDFKPIIQAEEKPVVEGTKGGADIEHGGVKAVPVEDFYPEPSATAAPKDYTRKESEEIATAYAYRTEYKDYGFNYWEIQAYHSKRSIRVNGTTCVPFAYINVFTELSEKTLPYGTYEFTTTNKPGTAEAGVRDDSQMYIGGSMFYFISQAYFNQGYLVPAAQWLIAEGTLTISKHGWEVVGKARNGKEIKLTGTSAIDYEGKPEGIEEVEGQPSEIRSKKILRDGHLMIIREGKMYNAQGAQVE